MAADVFINYRGADSNYAARLLYDRLQPLFGQQVFFDEKSIQPGDDYVLELLRNVRESKVLLAVIGPNWLARDSDGMRRIDDERDWIRRELATAYECGVRVIPVFTEGANPEDLVDLPRDISRLRTAQGLRLPLHHADDDLAKICSTVAKHVSARRRRRVALALVLAALLLIGLGVGLSFWFRGDGQQPTSSGSTTSGPTTSRTTSAETTTTTTSSSSPPDEPQVWWEGNLTLDGEAFQLAYTLDTSPPTRQPAGDIGLVCQLSCAANEIAGTEFVEWSKPGLPDRQQCVDLLNRNPGQRSLSVKEGTKGCFGTAERRVGRLEVDKISGPGKMTIGVRVWK